MAKTTKTDNHNPAAKLALRRHFLREYHADDSPHVLDCCQGGGLLWQELRKEFAVASYWGVDVKPKKGRLKLDSVRVLAQPGWPQNVVDIDTYGSPWKHWAAMLPNIARPTTVFLTIGQVQIGGGQLIKEAKEALELKDLRIPPAISAKLNRFAVPYLLAQSDWYGIIVTEALEAASSGNARYIGVRLEPRTKAAGCEADTSSRPKHSEPVKEVRNV